MIAQQHLYLNSLEEQTSSSSISINPPLDLITSGSVKIEDSALPATTTMKEMENISTEKDDIKTQTEKDKNSSNSQSSNTINDGFTEIVVMASVDTQSNQLKGT